MKGPITFDHSRYKYKLNRQIKDNLGKYLTSDNITVDDGRKKIIINTPIIITPRFQFDDKQIGGVSLGDGDGLGGDDMIGDEKSSSSQGHSELEKVIFTYPEFSDLIIEKLKLPELKPSLVDEMYEKKPQYNTIRKAGPRSLIHPRRTLKRALMRSLMSGSYQPGDPIPIVRSDLRVKDNKTKDYPLDSALIIYLMDVSGSVGVDARKIIREEVFILENVLERLYQKAFGSDYKGIKRRYVAHTSIAKEVTKEDFFSLNWMGGTVFSSAYHKLVDIISEEKKKGMRNFYVFQYTDGILDNDKKNKEETNNAIKALKDILPEVNLFGYTQMELGKKFKEPTHFMKILNYFFKDEVEKGHLALSEINTNTGENILNSIYRKLKTGR